MDISKIPLIVKDTGLTHYEVMWLYLVLHGDTTVPPIRFPSEVGKMYVIDCSNRLINNKSTTELFDKYELKDVPILDKNVSDVNSWIDTYRSLFKGRTPNKDMGIRGVCVTKMLAFITKYPKYANVNLILKATTYGIEDILKNGKPPYNIVPQADYFISKHKLEGLDEPLHYYCELISNISAKSIPIGTVNNSNIKF